VTVAELITRIRNTLYGVSPEEHPEEDTLSGAMLIGATTATVSTSALWYRGDYMEFDDGELAICAADGSAGSVTVRRAQRGTTAAARDSGEVIIKNPLYPYSDIQAAINRVFTNHLDGLWSWHKDSLTYTTGTHYYALDAYIDDVAEMYQYDLNSDGRYHPFPQGWFSVEQQKDTGMSATGTVLRIVQVYDSDETVYYTGKRTPNIKDVTLGELNTDERILELVVDKAVAILLHSRAMAALHDPVRGRRQSVDGTALRDASWYDQQFALGKNALRRILTTEIRPKPRYLSRTTRRY